METGVLREITPLGEHDFMYVADRHKKEFDFPIHCHDVMELNFLENAAGARRVVGDCSEVIGDIDLVLITSPDLEHVWEQHECQSEDIHEITVQFNIYFEEERSPFRTNPYMSIYHMMMRAKHGLSFSRQAIMTVYQRLVNLVSVEDKFLMAQEWFYILYVYMTSSEISLGWEVAKRTRRSGAMAATRSSRLAKVTVSVSLFHR